MAERNPGTGKKPFSILALTGFILIMAALAFVGRSELIAWSGIHVGRTLANMLVFSYLIPVPVGLAVFIMGIVAALRIRKHGQRGAWMATLDIILGLISFLFFAWFVVYSISFR